MPFNIYPDVDTATLLNKPVRMPILLAPGEAMGRFVPLADHVGLDPVTGVMQTTFIRIAMSGDPATPALQPTFELMAHDPELSARSEAPPLNLNKNVDLANGVELPDGVNFTAAGLAFFAPPVLDNVYLLKVATEISGTRFWIKITNSTGAPRQFVWVVADSDADAGQPWIHATYKGATPADIHFDAVAGQTSAETGQTIAIGNFGTGPFTIGSVTPALPAPYTISGLPVTLGPDPLSPPTVTVGFNAPNGAGDIAPQVFSFVTGNKVDPGPFGAGHNNQFILSAHTRLPAPSFAPSPHQFDPMRGQPGLAVKLFGEHFDVGNVSVRFGTIVVPSTVVSAEQISIAVPDMPPGSAKITVTTAGGSVTSIDEFRVPPLPVIDSVDPDSGRPGDVFSIFGSNFITEPGDFVVVLCVFPTDPGSPDPGRLTIVGTPTATRIDAKAPQLDQELRFQLLVSRSDGAEALSDSDFHITLL